MDCLIRVDMQAGDGMPEVEEPGARKALESADAVGVAVQASGRKPASLSHKRIWQQDRERNEVLLGWYVANEAAVRSKGTP